VTESCSSIIAGKVTDDDSGGHLRSTNPARLSDVVADVALGDATTFVESCRIAKASQPAWSRVPAPIRGRVIAEIGRLVEANA
jgi:aldehyde dehydrogenase (NAD+)